MPNRTIYLTKEQDLDFAIAQSTAKALGTSVSVICASAIKNYVDETRAAREIIESAMKGNK